MQPYIRKYNYISDYFWTYAEWASNLVVGSYPVTYYNVDWENSVYDKDLMGGSYEKYGVGKLSGIKWRKIQMVPVFSIETMNIAPNADETGLTIGQSEYTSFVIPSEYNILSTEWDFVHFQQDFMFHRKESSPIFVVTSVNPSDDADIGYNKISIKPVYSDALALLENQISSRFMFVEFTKRMHEINTANLLLKLESKHEQITEQLENLTSRTGLFLIPS